MRRYGALAVLIAVLATTFITSDSIRADAQSLKLCVSCISIRVGPAKIVRGPAPDESDMKFSELRLSDGSFRGFTANQRTYAIDGPKPDSMSGPRRKVLDRGPAGTYDSCGQWLTSVVRVGTVVYGFIHNETACNYEIGQTLKSMSVGVSTDDGLSWHSLGKVISGTASPVTGKQVGEGDCAIIRDSQYFYAYCGRPRDWTRFVARAPIADPGPGAWTKYFNGSWSGPGIGGDATPLQLRSPDGEVGIGGGVATWLSPAVTGLLGTGKGGLWALFSTDHIHFTALPEPLIPIDPPIWKRPAPSEFMGYVGLIDAESGDTHITNHAYLTYTYIRHGEAFDRRYLVFQNVTLALRQGPVNPQVGLALARWLDPKSGRRRSTTGPGSPHEWQSQLETTTGYLMTRAHVSSASVALQECAAGEGLDADHIFAIEACPDNAKRLRTAGWVYTSAHEATVPLYQCRTPNQLHFIANNRDCDGAGNAISMLGYALAE